MDLDATIVSEASVIAAGELHGQFMVPSLASVDFGMVNFTIDDQHTLGADFDGDMVTRWYVRDSVTGAETEMALTRLTQ
jgi:hypothetical protein